MKTDRQPQGASLVGGSVAWVPGDHPANELPPGPEWEDAAYPTAPPDFRAWAFLNRDTINAFLASDMGLSRRKAVAGRRTPR